MEENPKKDGEWGSWGLIIVLFAVGLGPIALILLLIKLFGKDGKRKKAIQAAQGSYQVSQPNENRARRVVGQVTRTPVAKKSNARGLIIGGAVIALVGFFHCLEPIDMMIWIGKMRTYYVEDLLRALTIVAGGGAMIFSGVSMSRSLRRYATYLTVLGDRNSIEIEELARTVGHSQRRVEKDLQKMIDKGYFGGKAYLHKELGCLLRNGNAEEIRRQKQEQQAAAQATAQAKEAAPEKNIYVKTLREIRKANDRIPDPVISAKIDRIEELTAKIFRAVEADPQKRGSIDQFLNYYLPTTQKLLDAYGEFESAGVEGENLRQAKQRIAKTLDTIVQGFEHQLDALYQTDALDVDSDIQVLETMLRWETASTEKDFGDQLTL